MFDFFTKNGPNNTIRNITNKPAESAISGFSKFHKIASYNYFLL